MLAALAALAALNCSVQGFWFRVQSVHTTLPNAGPARQVGATLR
jgi:hypothetical protein